jgi:hypothetical protein
MLRRLISIVLCLFTLVSYAQKDAIQENKVNDLTIKPWESKFVKISW